MVNPSEKAAYIITSAEQETPANVKGVEIMLSTYGHSAETVQKIKVPKSEGIVFSRDGLSPGGFFIVREDISPLDSVGLSREAALKIGYEILRLERQEAVLQKPF